MLILKLIEDLYNTDENTAKFVDSYLKFCASVGELYQITMFTRQRATEAYRRYLYSKTKEG